MATKTAPTVYKSLNAIFIDLALILKPAEELTVAEAAEKYRYLNNAGAYVGPWLNHKVPAMVEPMNTFTSRQHSGMIFVGPAQSGKPIAIDTPIATPDGWKVFGDVVPGDVVFDEHGEPTRVTYCTPTFVDRECFRITFDDGTSIVADGVHRWAVNDTWGVDPYATAVMDTNQLRRTYKIITSRGTPRFRYSIPVAGALQLPDADLPIDPYVLGLWLGDGSAHYGPLTLGAKDADELLMHVEIDTDFRVFSVSDDNERGTVKRVQLRHNDGTPFITMLKRAGLCKNKHIPAVYLRASERQRLELLRGIMDSDGTVTKTGRIQFSQSRSELFDQVVELVRSLGIKPMVDVSLPKYRYKGEHREGVPSYRMSFSVQDSTSCFKLNRQLDRYRAASAAKTRRPTHSLRRFIRDISPVESVPVRCISVENSSHLFLIGTQMVPTHNTDSLILNTLTYRIMCEPMDMMLVCPTMTDGRDFSIRRVDRLHMHSEEVGAKLLPGADADNKFDKQYRNGMLFTIGWPTPSQLAGKPIPCVIFTDRDRMKDDIEGDGEPFDLGAKRTTTFGSYAMTVAESSPSRPVTDPKWIPRTPHEAPPCEGILKLYNRGDRRRWNWPCPHCDQYFEGTFEHLEWDADLVGSNMEKADTVFMRCPHCQEKIFPDDRDGMQQWGIWLKDGQGIDELGRVFGPQPRTMIASFWLNGVAASFISWRKLVAIYLDANDEYERTGSEEALKKFYNNDLAQPYYPKSMLDDMRSPEMLKARSEPALPEREVPEGVRFLVALCDVQKNMWVVQVFGILPGQRFDTVLIDRFDVRKSKRTDADGDALWVKPNAYLEDWDELTEHVIEKQYPLGDGSGRKMGIRFVGCDSGGKAGVTSMAYAYFRRLREQNKHRRFILIKGDGKPNIPRTRISHPDSGRKDIKSAARGDIPVLILNSNVLKDDLNGRLDCMEPGKGMYRTPGWLSDSFYSELCAEIRTPKGWENQSGERNEAFDLSYYCIGLCVSELLGVERLNWESPPGWAAEWDTNDLVSEAEAPPRFAHSIESNYDFAKFAKALA